MSFKSVKRKRNLSYDVAASIRDAVLQGEYPKGSTIPTEPVLAQEFGVSRAVIRDATRILQARGLIEINQGKGMFVTDNADEALGEVLFIALKKQKASSHDVEAMLMCLLPEAAAAFTKGASQQQKRELQLLAERYSALHRNGNDRDQKTHLLKSLLHIIFSSCENRSLELLAPILLRFSSPIGGEDSDGTLAEELVSALQSPEPGAVRQEVRRILESRESGGLLAQAAVVQQEEF